MRRLAALSLGLVLAAPFSARAQGPHPSAFQNAMPAQGPAASYGGHICADCLKKIPRRLPASANAAPPTVIAESYGPTPGCAACASGIGGLPPGAVILGPGEAFVGGEAPGVAYVGGPAAAEPAPIGVMRTDYQAAAAGSPASYTPPAGAVPPYAPYAHASAAGAMPYGQPPLSQSMSTTHNRVSVLGHLMGLRRPTPFGARRQARQRAAHAAISYGDGNGAPEYLPASMVYGQR
jgi:hypothetical protein